MTLFHILVVADFKNTMVFFFGHMAPEILVPQPGIKPMTPALEPESLNC